MIFVFGVLSYAVSLAVFIYAMGFIVGFLTPTMLDAPRQTSLPDALLIDFLLLLAFSVQHSGMARAAFKRWWTKIVPQAAERSFYILFSSAATALIFVFWQPLGGVIWQAPEGWPRMAVIALYGFGWALLFYATFLIDHFDLFGLRQVWFALQGRTDAKPRFRTPVLYRLVRHPIYVGWLIIFWAAPTMTAAHLFFAFGTTIYILVAIQLEERDLIAQFGDDYASYRKRVPMLIPSLGGREPSEPQQSRHV